MIRLKDPILDDAPEPDGIELQPLREPDVLEMAPPYVPSARAAVLTSKEFAPEGRMVLEAVKRKKSFDWTGSRSALPPVVRQLERFGWTVAVREE